MLGCKTQRGKSEEINDVTQCKDAAWGHFLLAMMRVSVVVLDVSERRRRHRGALTQTQGCLSAWSAVIRLAGLIVNIWLIRFLASGVTVSHSGEGNCEEQRNVIYCEATGEGCGDDIRRRRLIGMTDNNKRNHSADQTWRFSTSDIQRVRRSRCKWWETSDSSFS